MGAFFGGGGDCGGVWGGVWGVEGGGVDDEGGEGGGVLFNGVIDLKIVVCFLFCCWFNKGMIK